MVDQIMKIMQERGSHKNTGTNLTELPNIEQEQPSQCQESVVYGVVYPADLGSLSNVTISSGYKRYILNKLAHCKGTQYKNQLNTLRDCYTYCNELEPLLAAEELEPEPNDHQSNEYRIWLRQLDRISKQIEIAVMKKMKEHSITLKAFELDLFDKNGKIVRPRDRKFTSLITKSRKRMYELCKYLKEHSQESATG
mmetsp:Transcript_25324/g.36289  ORF Transcript_25324/g.36289 Transcript_25324/m.36289 type:complete len:196 (-) Transcript_25324:12-599(-)